MRLIHNLKGKCQSSYFSGIEIVEIDEAYTSKTSPLYNIEQYNKKDHGKLWPEHFLYPQVAALEEELQKFNITTLRPKMIEYKLLR